MLHSRLHCCSSLVFAPTRMRLNLSEKYRPGRQYINTSNLGMDSLLSTVDMRVSTLDMHVSTLDRRVSKLSKNI